MDRASLRRIGDDLFEIPRDYREDLRVPARLVASEGLLEPMLRDRSVEQLLNVATLPGVARFVVGMPDMHQGYGFPVGGVAATLAPDGVVSPGGIGFDINCGVRLLGSELRCDELGSIEPLLHELSRSIPTGYGRGGRLLLDEAEMDAVLTEGCPYLVRTHELGSTDDLEYIESRGSLSAARHDKVSERAKKRGQDQLGTLGGGNHFLELQRLDAVFDAERARALGLFEGQLTVLIHTGSRGLGHQVCSDYVAVMDRALAARGVRLVDRQLACAPLSSPEGSDYFAAMCAAANFAWCNRQVLTARAREVFRRTLGRGSAAELRVVYDVAHNIAKLEHSRGERLCVHRKGATRAFGPESDEIPARYRGCGQPVFVPGSMGTGSFVLVGTDEAEDVSFASACHGAGRALSRKEAKRRVAGAELRRELEQRGIAVRCPSNSELAEEAPVAYKNVEAVTDVLVRSGIARKVARLRPVGVLKG